jgi:hypothetical protein
MKKQRRGKFTYIPKDEIAEVTTFNDVTFENDDLLDGAYVRGRKKYARGGVMKAMSLDEQAASAVGNDVWFSLPDMEKAELVEELVKSGMIVPTTSETDIRIMELIEQDEYADGGMMADGGEIEVGDKVKAKFAKYHSTVIEVFDDVEIPYAIIEYSDGKVKKAYLKDLQKVILGVAPEYVNPNYMADGGELDAYLLGARGELNSMSDEKIARTYANMKDLDYSDVLIEIKGNREERKDAINEILKEAARRGNPNTKLGRGGFDVGRWYRDSSGEEFKYIGEDINGNPLFRDGAKTIKKPYEDFSSSVKEEKLFGWFAEGGVATGGKFMVKYYLKETPETIKTKVFDDKDGAEFFFETIQDDDDIVVLPIEEVVDEVKAAPAKGKNLFSAAKPVPVAKAAAKKRERVEVKGISKMIKEYDELNAVIKNAESAKSVIGGELKEIGREKFLDLYEDRGFRPANFDLADGNENILLEVTDKYLKVEPEKAAILENFNGLLEVKTTYEFNAEILEKKVSDTMTVGDVVSMLIQDSKLLSDSDKENYDQRSCNVLYGCIAIHNIV